MTVEEENLPAAHAVRTDMPEASVMIRFTGMVGTLQLAGNQEVGQSEVHGQGAGAVLVGAVQRIDACAPPSWASEDR